MRRATLILLTIVSCAVAAPVASGQEDPRARPQFRHPQAPGQTLPQDDLHGILAMRRRLVELDRLLALGSIGRAEGLLEDLAQHGSLQRELVTRRIELAQLKGDHEQAVELCREALVDQQRTPSLWRELTTSLLALDRPDSARTALGRFLATSPNRRSGAIVGVEMLLGAERPRMAVALIDSMRAELGEPRLLGIERVQGLLAGGRQPEAAAEASAELRANPFNLSMLRTGLLEVPYRPGAHAEFRSAVADAAREPAAGGAERVLLANLLLVDGDGAAALEAVRPLAARPGGVLQLLQNAVILLRELDLRDDRAEAAVTSEYLLGVLERLTGPDNPSAGTRRRAAELLAEACDAALEHDLPGGDPRRAVDRLVALLARVRSIHPASEQLYAAQLRLATYTRDRLRDPLRAARNLEHLLLDLDLPTEGVALVRLTLGECYLAAGDTARGRTVLTSLARDREFRRAGGHAHYHLARLDLAGGDFVTARDRFAVIAMDNPAAPYANDALELGLAVAEEMENPSGGPDILALYAASVYHDLTADEPGRLAALERFVAEASARLDPEQPQHLLERGRHELALLLAAAGREDEALAVWTELVARHPRGRFAAEALHRSGRLHAGRGETADARRNWERLLALYPDYLFMDDVRDDLRGLPQ